MSDYCDRSTELLRCAQSYQQRLMSSRVKLKPSLRRNASNKIAPSSIFCNQFIPLARQIAGNLGLSNTKMCQLESLFLEQNKIVLIEHNTSLVMSNLSQSLQSEVMSLNASLKQILAITPGVLKEVSHSSQLSRHTKAVIATLEHRMADLSMRLRNFFQQKISLPSETIGFNVDDHAVDEMNCQANVKNVSNFLDDSKVIPTTNTMYKQESFILGNSQLSRSNVSKKSEKSPMSNFSRTQSNHPSIPFDQSFITDRIKVHSNNQQADSNKHHMQMLLAEPTQTVVRQRDSAIQNTEQTIVHLGEIYQQFSFLVKEQGDLVTRIDTHLDDASLNVDAAHGQLVDFMRKISSRRAFMLKVFASLVLFFFVITFFIR